MTRAWHCCVHGISVEISQDTDADGCSPSQASASLPPASEQGHARPELRIAKTMQLDDTEALALSRPAATASSQQQYKKQINSAAAENTSYGPSSGSAGEASRKVHPQKSGTKRFILDSAPLGQMLLKRSALHGE